jgi:hypothetical protein
MFVNVDVDVDFSVGVGEDDSAVLFVLLVTKRNPPNAELHQVTELFEVL